MASTGVAPAAALYFGTTLSSMNTTKPSRPLLSQRSLEQRCLEQLTYYASPSRSPLLPCLWGSVPPLTLFCDSKIRITLRPIGGSLHSISTILRHRTQSGTRPQVLARPLLLIASCRHRVQVPEVNSYGYQPVKSRVPRLSRTKKIVFSVRNEKYCVSETIRRTPHGALYQSTHGAMKMKHHARFQPVADRIMAYLLAAYSTMATRAP